MMKNTTESDAKVDALETRDFVPSASDIIDSHAGLVDSYRQNSGAQLWDAFAPKRRAIDRNAILRDEAEIRGAAFLMAD